MLRRFIVWVRSRDPSEVRRWIVLGAAGLLSAIAYVYLISAGKFTNWPNYTSDCCANTNLLAEGFRAGRLSLAKDPSAALLAQSNPLDAAHEALWVWDASLYRGRFYLYFGPVPALLLALGKVILRIHGVVGDNVLTFLFATARLVFGILLLDLAARRVFARTPVWLVAIGTVVFALANPVPYALGRPQVYEVAIVSGQCFLVAGLYFALRAVVSTSNVTTACALASSFWALAAGSRASLLPALVLLSVATLVALKFRVERPRLVRPALALGLPMAIGVGLLALYNYARFDSFFETGMNYQMSRIHFATDILYAPSNIYSYLMRPLSYECRFPFVIAPWELWAAGIARWLALLPGYYASEPLAGALNSCPWVLCGALGVLALGKRGKWLVPERAYLVIALAMASTLTLLPALGLWFATMRFLLDAMTGATLLSAIGTFALWERLSERPRWVKAFFLVPLFALAAYSMAVGVLLGMQSYFSHFQTHNPAHFAKLREKLSLCSR